MIIMEEVRLNLAGTLGAPYSTNSKLISFNSIVSGSVITSGVVDTSQSTPSSTYDAWGNVQPSGAYVGFALVSSSYVANGFTPPESSKINLPLVLGIAIPSGILLIVIVIVVVVKMKKRNSIK